jgi:hypothetical protein
MIFELVDPVVMLFVLIAAGGLVAAVAYGKSDRR